MKEEIMHIIEVMKNIDIKSLGVKINTTPRRSYRFFVSKVNKRPRAYPIEAFMIAC